MSNLPPFAKQWAQQWKRAAPALQAVRDAELRQLAGADALGSTTNVVAGHRVYDRYPQRHGMVTMQKWLMRRALIESQLTKISRGNAPQQESSS